MLRGCRRLEDQLPDSNNQAQDVVKRIGARRKKSRGRKSKNTSLQRLWCCTHRGVQQIDKILRRRGLSREVFFVVGGGVRKGETGGYQSPCPNQFIYSTF